ncbi:MAG: hypothetical protein V1905_00630 [bacterium]
MKKQIFGKNGLSPSYLRIKHPVFHYDRFAYTVTKKGLEIVYYFRTEPNFNFISKIIIGGTKNSRIKKIGKNNINILVFHLGLVEMLNYWKATCSPDIQIHCGHLDKKQKSWWKNLISNGMGQYFFTNSIDFTKNGFISIKTDHPGHKTNQKKITVNDGRVLVPIGGGKDSSVTIELLRRNKEWNITSFVLEGNPASKVILKNTKINRAIVCQRKIDPLLLELNNKGYLNGHVPFSAFLAFLTYLSATLTGIKYIVFSNERSANEGNVKYLKHQINHQWSKTYTFENRFRGYINDYLFPKIIYFSLLRPLYELQIARIFSRFPKYFSSFVSCNSQSKMKLPDPIAHLAGALANRWCGSCPKCLFTYTILYPYIENREIVKIFGKDLFKDQNLLSIMDELINPKLTKPFECVGTKIEARVAFYLCLKKMCGDLPILLSIFKRRYLKKYPHIDTETKRLINSWDNNNNLPKQFIKLIN